MSSDSAPSTALVAAPAGTLVVANATKQPTAPQKTAWAHVSSVRLTDGNGNSYAPFDPSGKPTERGLAESRRLFRGIEDLQNDSVEGYSVNQSHYECGFVEIMILADQHPDTFWAALMVPRNLDEWLAAIISCIRGPRTKGGAEKPGGKGNEWLRVNDATFDGCLVPFLTKGSKGLTDSFNDYAKAMRRMLKRLNEIEAYELAAAVAANETSVAEAAGANFIAVSSDESSGHDDSSDEDAIPPAVLQRNAAVGGAGSSGGLSTAAPKAKKACVTVAHDDISDDEQLPSSLDRSDHYPQTVAGDVKKAIVAFDTAYAEFKTIEEERKNDLAMLERKHNEEVATLNRQRNMDVAMLDAQRDADVAKLERKLKRKLDERTAAYEATKDERNRESDARLAENRAKRAKIAKDAKVEIDAQLARLQTEQAKLAKVAKIAEDAKALLDAKMRM